MIISMKWLKRKRPKLSLSTEDEINENYFDLVADKSLNEFDGSGKRIDSAADELAPAALASPRLNNRGRIREVSPDVSGLRASNQNNSNGTSTVADATIDLTHAAPSGKTISPHVLDLSS